MRAGLFTPLKIAVALAVIGGAIKLVEPISHVYWNVWFKLQSTAALSNTVVVTLPETPQGDTAGNIAARNLQARTLDRIRLQKPARVFLDVSKNTFISDSNDKSLTRALDALGNTAVLVVHPEIGVDDVEYRKISVPPASIVGSHDVVVSGWNVNFFGYAISAPYTVRVGQKIYPTLSTVLANRYQADGGLYFPNFAVEPDSVTTVSAATLENDAAALRSLAGKNVIVANLGSEAQQPLGWFGRGKVAPVYLDIAGADELRAGTPRNLGWLPLIALFAIFASLGSRRRDRGGKLVFYGIAVASVVVLPGLAQHESVYSAPGPAIVAMFLYGSIRLWQRWRQRVEHTSASGLPNFAALVEDGINDSQDLVVASINRYEEFLATLPRDLHAECAHQIARRLSLGCGSTVIYHDDAGHFAWVEDAKPLEAQLGHLEGLRSLFTAPLGIGGYTFDTNIHFGLDRNASQPPSTRINSAVASAAEAEKNVRLVEEFAPDRLAEATWELSLNARIDEGLRKGDIWLAYQAQWDHRRRRVRGAEALIRWDHPTRGPIPPDAFILQAERAGRIDTITYWVLEEAITASLRLMELIPDFQMSVNLSAQMVDKGGLVEAVAEIVRKRSIDCRNITFEVTETWGMRNRHAARENLNRLRAMGFRLSIDDFGTGEASLAYLAEMPSDEIKLDRRFVSMITSSERNQHIVASTIGLAHALGQEVVAEGVENDATFRMLDAMGCDISQGYFIGHPLKFSEFRAELLRTGEERANP
ncbi:EAL domain-containing protein [Novosphingobium tardum]|uniref:EAL domain-containing protein n=1 Tax=Novosphingobium tardum TaxID=1538021 RepID=A0ABV8RQW8_9SPHN